MYLYVYSKRYYIIFAFKTNEMGIQKENLPYRLF